ncbi:MAG TPA: trehalose-phosphatase [Steroidobacteraceae bacterium]|nr:trehalose-phosphatase [Steroidobacteraceae bacterium]
MTLRGASIIERNIALFLDVDGTLLEIAATPDAVKVPAALRNTLHLASGREHGALALISGRCISELDRLFAPYVFAAAGQHGLERRDAKGKFMRPPIATDLLNPARAALVELQMQHNGLLLEDKGTALALHFRLAPKLEPLVRASMAAIAAPLADRFIVREGKCVLELAPSGISKRMAIQAFMSEFPFEGRVPVFVGDDVTDEDGFEAVNDMDGYSIRVGAPSKTLARYGFSSVSAVVTWLRRRNLNRPPTVARLR